MTASLTLYIPRPPDIANGRAHWATVASEKRALWEQLRIRAATHHGIPVKPAQPIARADLTVVWHYVLPQHRPDPDNVIRRMKPVIDFLVENGWLAGDTADQVSWRPAQFKLGTVGLPPMCSVELLIEPVR